MKTNKMSLRSALKKENNSGETYSCTMHPEVKSDKPGNCPKCGMTLVKKD